MSFSDAKKEKCTEVKILNAWLSPATESFYIVVLLLKYKIWTHRLISAKCTLLKSDLKSEYNDQALLCVFIVDRTSQL